MKIAILGAAGQMGKWLVRYFADRNHHLTVSDVRRNKAKLVAKNHGVKFAINNLEAVEGAELVVVSVPMDKTAIVLYEVAPYLRKNTIITEISSIKSNVINVLAEISKYSIKPLSLHPLFGPGMHKMKKKVAVIPVLNLESEKAFAEKIFPDAKIIVIDSKKHDKAMAVTLSLPYFMNMTLASILSNEDILMLKELGGPTFLLQLTLAGSIMFQSSKLHATLHTTNEYSSAYLNKMFSEAENIRKLIEKEDTKKFCRLFENIQKILSQNLNLMDIYEKMYATLEVLEG